MNKRVVIFLFPFLTSLQVLSQGCNPPRIVFKVVEEQHVEETSVEFSWEVNDAEEVDVESYKLEYKLSTSATWNTIATSYPIPDFVDDLIPGRQYSFRVTVRYQCAGMLPMLTETKTLVVQMEASRPSLLSPDVTDTSATIKWQSSEGASDYLLEVSRNSTFSPLEATYQVPSTVLSKVVPSLSANTFYHYRIKSLNVSGASGYSGGTLLTKPNSPAAGTATAVSHNSFIANWSGAAAGFRIDVAKDSKFSSSDLLEAYADKDVGNTFSALISGLNPATAYHYRLRAYNNGGVSGNSSAISVLTAPAAPDGVAIGEKGETSLVVSWNQSQGVIAGYKIDLSIDNFSTYIHNGLDLGKVVSHTFSGLNPSSTYYIRVRAYNATGNSAPSQSVSAVTLPLAPKVQSAASPTLTSFEAKWDASVGASGYLLDVSADPDFSNFLEGYENFSVIGTSQLIDLLVPNTIYYYRVSAVNPGGESSHSEVMQQMTFPAAPADVVVFSRGEHEIQIGWQKNEGLQRYELDVSRSGSFDDFIPGYDSKSIEPADQSCVVAGLDAGSKYFVRMRAVNSGGVSVNTTAQSATTRCVRPENLNVHSVGAAFFSLQWAPVFGAESYRIDVATEETFATILDSYNNSHVAEPATTITALQPGTEYFIRVRAVNDSGAGISSNSHMFTALTLPAAPGNFTVPFSEVGSESLHIYWNAVASAVAYELDISIDESFGTLLPGYSKKVLSKDLTEYIADALSPDQIYYLRIRARNQSGVSEFSGTRVQRTKDSNGNSRALAIAEASELSLYGGSSTDLLSVTTNGDGIGSMSAFLYHRRCSTGEYHRTPMQSAGGNRYTVNVLAEWFDELGMQYYYEVSDQSGVVAKTDSFIAVKKRDAHIPLHRFGSDSKNYHIIALPDSLIGNEDADIEELFVNALGEYRNTEWRLFSYEDGQLVDYPRLRVNKMERGRGYWFISRDEVSLDFGSATTYANATDKPFELSLKKGWNLIGNPYPFDVSWNEVRDFGDNGDHIRPELWGFDSDNFDFLLLDVMPAYAGGYVYANHDATLVFPTHLEGQITGGRVAQVRRVIPREGDWMVTLRVSRRGMSSRESFFGMASDAHDGFDSSDLVPPPAVGSELFFRSFLHDRGEGFLKNIIRRKEKYTWFYKLRQSTGDEITISWDKKLLSNVEGRFLFQDVREGVLINMKEVDHYTTRAGSADFEIHYNISAAFQKDQVILGKPFPNPFQDKVEIPYDYENDIEVTSAALVIYDMSGRIVAECSSVTTEGGVKTMLWDGIMANGQVAPAGVYLFRIFSLRNERLAVRSGKIMKH